MTPYLFIFTITLFLFVLFRWAFRELPSERWQILGVIPSVKESDGFWQGINLTYYGLFTATAYVFAIGLAYILLGALSVPAGMTTVILLVICSASIPASRTLAHIIEKKPHTASVGAASFVGIMIAPFALWGIKHIFSLVTHTELNILPTLAVLGIAYAFGEGIGRLACISFGCCYGKPLDELPVLLRRILGFRPFVFAGSTKKIAYADHLDEMEIFPVQAITAVLYCVTGIMGILLYISGFYRFAFLLTLTITQLWRFLSEFLRADYRGSKKISIYQIMALFTIPYGFFIADFFYPLNIIKPADLLMGFKIIGNPLLLIFLQILWMAMFWHSGRSHVTGARLKFHVNHTKI
ncbi:MAG: prolipoprotein diacylglyceryl transferase [Proteobacteria bacterium]|nr:prolipoprotein diacylglyceryl transferase [Pseudomonadota bacterium]